MKFNPSCLFDPLSSLHYSLVVACGLGVANGEQEQRPRRERVAGETNWSLLALAFLVSETVIGPTGVGCGEHVT